MTDSAKGAAGPRKPKSSSPLRRIAIQITVLLLVVGAVEAINQVIFYVRFGSFVWSGIEVFNVRKFADFVNDGRVVTMKRNFQGEVDEGWGVAPWSISTDAWGFRKGTHTTDPNCPSVGFIGASVPFGWGVSDTASLPSKVFDLMKSQGDARCVFNAAIPSYALRQIIARYETEVFKKFNVQALYVQFLDPTSQLLGLGPNWDPDANWTNFPQYGFKLVSFSPAKYSATVAIVQNALQSFGWTRPHPTFLETFSPTDTATIARFHAVMSADLGRLRDLALATGVRRMIFGSFSAPQSSQRVGSYSEARRVAIDMFNGELRDFAAAHPGDVVFLDTQKILDGFPEPDVYVDACCHLTERGNAILAQHVLPLLPH